MNIETLIRSNIKSLKPYRSARQDYSSGILLDANENSFGSAIAFDGVSLNRYPDPFQAELRTKLAALHGVQTENVFVGVGSDEVIDLLIRLFCEPVSDAVLIIEPTYGMYRVAAAINNVPVRSCLLNDNFQIDLAAVSRSLIPNTKMIFCCSPNNPTANLLRAADILQLCKETQAIVVVDEAYFDFADGVSLSSLVNDIPNLIVLKTLSKAWGLAGIRLGYGIAHPTVISYLMKIKPPYNINALTSIEALKALDNFDLVKQRIKAIVTERKRLAAALSTVSYVQTVFPSDANFLLVRCENATSVYRSLAQRNVIVRDRSTEPTLENCLRITVGTPEQNDILIKTMKELQ
ncbi:MAG: histidinol-phosphate transaminase [Ignavibacteriales bacterium]|nr:histidinol-phosphate transaminase [Ignavibacteriales bacterium]MBI3787680.1 histidinol-phosphate transaminase [Ignavibacteriales bacterium]